MRKQVAGWLLAASLLAGCDAADDVRVQPLPSLDGSTPEERAGLPVVSGLWRFAGWELAPGDTGRVGSDLPGFGELRLETQRLDSIAGFYMAGEAALPLIGEVRRDSVVALVGGGRFLAGRVTADTLWLVLTSLVASGSWPDDARAAFVRSAVGTRFVRIKGQRPMLAAADSVAMDSARLAAAQADTLEGRIAGAAPRAGTPLTGGPFPRQGEPSVAAVTPRTGTPLTGAPFPRRTESRMGEARPRQAESQPSEPRIAEPQPSEPRIAEPEEQAAPPEQAEPEPEQAEPEPEPEPEPRRERRPRLLGVPVDSLYSPTAARAISRPGGVSASR